MFTNTKAKYYGDNKVLIDSACLSGDTKPTTGVANGSKCIEMDTGKTYMFNEEDSEWEELPSSGGGGGGDSDFHKAAITFGVTGGNGYGQEFLGILLDSFDDDANLSGVRITYEDSVRFISTEVFQTSVTYPATETVEVNIVNDSRIIVSTSNLNNVYTVTGDAEVVTVTEHGETGNFVYVYGDCTITTVGNKYGRQQIGE